MIDRSLLDDDRLWTDDPDFAPYFRDYGGRFYWIAPKWAVAAGYDRKTRRLNGDRIAMAAQCRDETRRLAEFVEGGGQALDHGSLAWLIRRYATDPTGPVRRNQQQNTRATTHFYLGVLDGEIGDKHPLTYTAADALALYDRIDEGGKHRTKAHKTIAYLRQVVRYGVAIEAPGCQRLDAILRVLRFAAPRPRQVAPSYDEAMTAADWFESRGDTGAAIMVQMQADLGARLTEIIGKWEKPEGGEQGAIRNRRREVWRPGLVWPDFGAGLETVRLSRAKTRHSGVVETVFRIARLDRLQARLALVPPEKRIGPVVLDTRSGLPPTRNAVSQKWARMRKATGMREEVTCRDLRAGLITDAEDAGVSESDRAKAAAHTDPATTRRYSRSTEVQTRVVETVADWRRKDRRT